MKLSKKDKFKMSTIGRITTADIHQLRHNFEQLDEEDKKDVLTLIDAYKKRAEKKLEAYEKGKNAKSDNPQDKTRWDIEFSVFNIARAGLIPTGASALLLGVLSQYGVEVGTEVSQVLTASAILSLPFLAVVMKGLLSDNYEKTSKLGIDKHPFQAHKEEKIKNLLYKTNLLIDIENKTRDENNQIEDFKLRKDEPSKATN